MANLLDIRRRIRSVKNTQQITRAMKTVSAAKLRRAQDRIMAARPYAEQLKTVLANISARIQDLEHPLLAERPEETILLVIITADRGLCGAFNANVTKMAKKFILANADKKIEVVAVGKKSRDFCRREGIAIVEEHVGIFSQIDFQHARAIGDSIVSRYSSAEVDAVYLAYNEFKSVIQQNLVTQRLLPMSSGEFVQEDAGQVDYIYEQPPEEIFQRLLPQYVDTQVQRALLESAAAEHGARMAAMDTASRNAAEMIDTLTLNMNRIRQAAITREIIEVVSGASV